MKKRINRPHYVRRNKRIHELYNKYYHQDKYQYQKCLDKIAEEVYLSSNTVSFYLQISNADGTWKNTEDKSPTNSTNNE